MSDLAVQTVLVVGGSSGIGEACVRAFLDSGAKVFFCSNDREAGETLQRALSTLGKVEFIFCEVTDEKSIKDVVTHLSEGLHCLVNVVGTHPEDRKIDAFSAADFDHIFAVNVRSYFLFCKWCLPLLRPKKGSIINIASMVGSIGQRCAVTYAASKGAVLALTKSLALDEGHHGVRVNSVSPGIIQTPLLDRNTIDNVRIKGHVTFEEEMASMASKNLLGRIGDSKDVAAVCVFLASEASRFITGVDIPVTGGAEVGYGIKYCPPGTPP